MNKTQRRNTVLLSAAFVFSVGEFAQADLWGDMKSAAQRTLNDAKREVTGNSRSEPEPVNADKSQATRQPPAPQPPPTSTPTKKKASSSVSEPQSEAVTNAPKAGAINTSDVDVIGLRLGMTKDEAMAAIAAHSKDLNVSAMYGNGLFDKTGKEIVGTEQLIEIAATRATHMKNRETIYVDYPFAPNPEKVMFIGRIDEYFGDNQLSLDVVKSAIIRKYGEPTLAAKGTRGISMVWVFGESGQQQDSERLGKKCIHGYLMVGINPRAERHLRSNNVSNVPGHKECGVTLTVVLDSPIRNKSLLRKLTTSLHDHAGAIKARENTKLYAADIRKNVDKVKLERAQEMGGPVL